MDREPLHNVQNHINWCWATAAKIVGVEYCHRNRLPIHAGINIEHANTIRKDCQGLRPQICGLCKGMLTVDAMQLDIVEHAIEIPVVICQKMMRARPGRYAT